MQQPDMISEMNYDFDIWYKIKDPIFSEISKNSRIPDKWLVFSKIINSEYGNSIIKPINKYVQALVPPPNLVSIVGNTVRLRQENHAEFFLLYDEKNKNFKNIDRPWMRQYYNTDDNFAIPDNCFDKIFKFYVPWYIDADTEISYLQPSTDSPFKIYEVSAFHNTIDHTKKYLEPDFVPFSFKKVGSHMIDNLYGKIKRQSAMFDISFQCDDIMLERVKEFYNERQAK